VVVSVLHKFIDCENSEINNIKFVEDPTAPVQWNTDTGLQQALGFFTCKNVKVANNTFENFIGRTVMATGLSNKIEINNNVLSWETFHSSSRGIILDWSQSLSGYDYTKAPYDCHVTNNKIDNCNMSIFVGGSTHDVFVDKNIVTNFGMGIGTYRGDLDTTHTKKTYNHTITNNIFSYQKPYGGGSIFNPAFLIQDVQNLTFSNNKFIDICYAKISEMDNFILKNSIITFRDQVSGETATRVGLEISDNNVFMLSACQINLNATAPLSLIKIMTDVNNVITFNNNHITLNACIITSKANAYLLHANVASAKIDLIGNIFKSEYVSAVYQGTRFVVGTSVTALNNRYKGITNFIDPDNTAITKNVANNYVIAT